MEQTAELQQTTSETLTLCSFSLAGRLFGIDILDIKEICSEIVISPIHHAPKAIPGYMNIRGQIHLVIDLRTVFKFESTNQSSENRIIIFKTSIDEPFGVIVDSINDVVKVNSDEIVERRHKDNTTGPEIQELRKAGAMLSLGVCKLPKGLIIVLNSRAIIEEAISIK